MDSETDNGESGEETKIVRIRLFATHEAAALAASNLEGHGIKCWVDSDDCAGVYPNLTTAAGVSLSVQKTNAEAADSLLKSQATPEEIKRIEAEAVLAPQQKNESFKKVAWIQILIGFLLGIGSCLFYQSKSEPVNITHYHYTADGKRDQGWIYRSGRLIEYEEDRNLDGAWDHWTYYEHGRAAHSEYDNNFDGKPDEFWMYQDDGTDCLKADTDFNGIPDEFSTYKYGIIQQEEMKPNGIKFATEKEIFKNGVLVEIWRGGDSNGNFKEVVRYDPFFEPVSTNVFNLLTPTSP